MITGDEIDALRLHCRPFCEWACIGGKSDEKNPNYRWVTGNRDFGPGYSSCADLAHMWLYVAGVRLPWVNTHLFHDGDMGKPGFDYQVNISRLVYDARGLSVKPNPGRRFQVGDILISGNDPKGYDYHAMVVLEHDGFEALQVAEYGQPGGHIKLKRCFDLAGSLYLEGRLTNKKLQRVLPFDQVVLEAAEQGKLEGVNKPWEGS